MPTVKTIRQLLSPEEVASLLGVTRATLAVWRSTARYPLPFVRVGRRVMYRPEDVEQFIQSRTVQSVEID